MNINSDSHRSKRSFARAASTIKLRAALVGVAVLATSQISSHAIHDLLVREGTTQGAFSDLVTSESYQFINNSYGNLGYVEWGADPSGISSPNSITFTPQLASEKHGDLRYENHGYQATGIQLAVDFQFALLVGAPSSLVGYETITFDLNLVIDPTENTLKLQNQKRNFSIEGIGYEMTFFFVPHYTANNGEVLGVGEGRNTLRVPANGGVGLAILDAEHRRVPDTGSSFAMLGSGLACMAFLRRLRPAK